MCYIPSRELSIVLPIHSSILPLFCVELNSTGFSHHPHQNNSCWASLVAQWLRVCLPMQGTQVWALVREDPTCRGATKRVRHNYWAWALEPVSHNYWAWALEPASHNYWAHVPQLLKPVCLEPVLRNKRSHDNEKPAHCNEEWPPLAATRESPHTATKTQHSQQ